MNSGAAKWYCSSFSSSRNRWSGFEVVDWIGRLMESWGELIRNGQSRDNGSTGYTKYRTNKRQRKTEGPIRNGQSRDNGSTAYTRHRANKRQRKPKDQSGMDNPETMAALGTQDTRQISLRENRRTNQEWTIQRQWQHWVHKIQDK